LFEKISSFLFFQIANIRKIMSFRNLICSVGIILAFIAPTHVKAETSKKLAPPANPQMLDQRLAEVFKASGVPGASVVVIENNQIILKKGYGVADVAAKRMVDPDTLFRAGSISKSIVGVAVMLLVEEGKLDLNAKVADLAPEIVIDNTWEKTDPVRLVHLMEHTAGLDDIKFRHYLLAGPEQALSHAVLALGPYASRWKPGMYMSYSNAGPVLAAAIVEKVSGLSWAEFTKKRIFDPLNMSTASWTRQPQFSARQARSYRDDGITEEPYVDIIAKPSGALNLTAEDLSKLAMMFIGRGTLNGVTLLKPESIDRIEQPKSTEASRLGLQNGYGLGNYADIQEKAVFQGHDGGIDAFAAGYVYQPAHGAAFVIMLNGAQGDLRKAKEIIYAYLQQGWQTPTLVEVKSDQKVLAQAAGIYQSITTRQELLVPLERMGNWAALKLMGSSLMYGDKERKSVAPGVFQQVDKAAPSFLIHASSDGVFLLSPQNTSRLVPLWEVVLKAVFGAIYVLTLLMSLGLLVWWSVAACRGKTKEQNFWAIRLLPALALCSLPMMLGATAFIMSLEGALNHVGTISVASALIFLLSLWVPVSAIWALDITMKNGKEVKPGIRLMAWTSTTLTLIACVYLVRFGWLGLMTWR
jgi:CubicO group peptidase (beta-lactamase class C family)